MGDPIPDDLIYASFFFIDIVGLSNPILSTETQRTKIQQLNSMIYECKAFEETPKNDLFILPTGDGMLIGFKEGLEQPVSLAIELHARLKSYNQKVLETEKIETRIGCNIGHIFIVKDLFDNVNLWGPGAILARRVMDLGNANHILLPSNMVDDLFEMSDKFKKIIHPIHDFAIKHDGKLLVYTLYGEDFGNSEPPKSSKPDIAKPVLKYDSMCQKIVFNIKLKDFKKLNRVVYERIYELVNHSVEPIYDIQVDIMTHSKLDVQSLNIKAFDENNDKLTISKILSPSDLSKNITVKLNRPIFQGEEGRTVMVIYEKNEPVNFFQHRFLMDTNNFELNFITPFDFPNKNPNFFFIDNNNNKKQIDLSTKTSQGRSYISTWKINEKVHIHDIFRLEY